MTAIPFCKFHGFGNDYIVIERDKIGSGVALGDLAVAMCRRNTGVGADGIAVIEKLDGAVADYNCEIVNPDGSTAGFSGNGTRCAVAYLYHNGLWTLARLYLETRSGVKTYDLIERKGEGEFWFEAEIGKPKFASDEIPILTETRLETVVNRQLTTANRQLTFSAVNVGNPVACIFVEDFNFDWRGVGRAMETHEIFPERANIVFVRIMDRENLEIRIWERGAGETAASGTCASGAAVLSALTQGSNRHVFVHSPGGVTEVLWRDDDEIVITGRADFSYCGEWPVASITEPAD